MKDGCVSIWPRTTLLEFGILAQTIFDWKRIDLAMFATDRRSSSSISTETIVCQNLWPIQCLLQRFNVRRLLLSRWWPYRPFSEKCVLPQPNKTRLLILYGIQPPFHTKNAHSPSRIDSVGMKDDVDDGGVPCPDTCNASKLHICLRNIAILFDKYT